MSRKCDGSRDATFPSSVSVIDVRSFGVTQPSFPQTVATRTTRCQPFPKRNQNRTPKSQTQTEIDSKRATQNENAATWRNIVHFQSSFFLLLPFLLLASRLDDLHLHFPHQHDTVFPQALFVFLLVHVHVHVHGAFLAFDVALSFEMLTNSKSIKPTKAHKTQNTERNHRTQTTPTNTTNKHHQQTTTKQTTNQTNKNDHVPVHHLPTA